MTPEPASSCRYSTSVNTEPDLSLTIGELEFRFFPTVHYVPCWAARISNGTDGDLFYTADTGSAANLTAPASGSRVIVAEGTGSGGSQEPIASRGHMTPAEAGTLARQAGAQVLVLSHLWAENDPRLAVKEAATTFGGPVELATPGMRLNWQGH
jgi:ribonuclease BN (tRNA processing enzyme)